MKTPEPDDKESGAGVNTPLPEYPGLPSKSRTTTVVVVPKKKRTKNGEKPAAEPSTSEPQQKKA